MESIIQNNTSQYNITEDETEETLSFRNFSINDADGTDSINTTPKSTTSPPDLFEFFTGSPNPVLRDRSEDELLNEYQKRDYLSLVRSNSFRRSKSQIYGVDVNRFPINYQSNSGRAPSDGRMPIDCSYHAHKVNITTLTSMSAKSRRRMFMFGMVRFKPEMELSAIKERQTRRTPAPMFPAAVEKVAGSSAGRGKGGHNWGLVKSLRGRSHLYAVLARSFGCISLNNLN